MPNTSRWDFERAVLASDLPAPRRLILLALATRADAETCRIPDEYSPSHARIADDTGLSRRTVVDHLAALETGGWVKITRPSPAQQRAEHKPNQYRLRIPKNARHTPETGVQELHPDTPEASATAAHGASAGAAPHQETRVQLLHTARVQELHTYQTTNQTKEQSAAAQPPAPAREPAHTHASPRTRERPTAAELNRTAARPDAYRLVAAWANTQPPGRILDPDRRELAKHLDTLLAQGATLTILKAALDLWSDKGRTPSFLPHAYREAATQAQPEGQTGHPTRDVRGSRVRQPARGSARGEKARAWLALGKTDTDPSDAAWSPRVIEGGTRDAG